MMQSKTSVPSIFNNVLGPVMRGPSSSHVVSAARIGHMLRCILTPDIKKIVIEFSRNSSLAHTYHSQGSDLGLACGLLGIELSDPEVQNALSRVDGLVPLQYTISDEAATPSDNYANHPNNYKIRLISQGGSCLCIQAISTGGGMFEIWEIDKIPISLQGDFYALLAMLSPECSAKELSGRIVRLYPRMEEISLHNNGESCILHCRSRTPFSTDLLDYLKGLPEIKNVLSFSPVLPVLSAARYDMPFYSFEEFQQLLKRNKKASLWEFAVSYESARGHITEKQVFDMAGDILSHMRNSVSTGLKPVKYSDRILPSQAFKIRRAEATGSILPDPLINRVIESIAAVMDAKSAMKPIVAAPTAGSCGCLPGTLIGLAEHLQLSHEKQVKALLAAGLIGVFFCQRATFAAEICGCQVECGAASAMTAGAVAQLLGGSAEQCLSAASMALSSVTGLACDPVAGRVEVPCLGKNMMAGANALFSANMALAGFNCVVPLNEVIDAVYEIGKALPQSLRCTLGGLGLTPASKRLERVLEKRQSKMVGPESGGKNPNQN